MKRDITPPRRVWEDRTGTPPDPLFIAFTESAQDDAPFITADIAGSIAHVAGLKAAGLIGNDDAKTLIHGLQGVHADLAAGNWRLDPALEDVHMNVEHRLQAKLGPLAGRLHTGRSRNDQVALDIVLVARKGLAEVAHATHGLSTALTTLAEVHAETPWVAKTHGQPAQPATLGFLLLAHAYRAHDLTQRAIETFHASGESPLGAGAVAGSTLPLKPTATAKLLGLKPLRNALLATGTRDIVIDSATLAAKTGLVTASLASDLLDLLAGGAYAPPAAFTSGSSLMPHKRNPDALELVRAKGRMLGAHPATLHAVLAGLGLGYHRDFQTTKPVLTRALTDAHQCLLVLERHVTGGRIDIARLEAMLGAPGITTTDATEALVRSGVPFRDAYAAVARAAHDALDQGVPLADAIAAQGLGVEATQAAIDALTPDPARRATRGGPAPECVHDSVETLETEHAALAAKLRNVKAAARQPFLLLELSGESILAETNGTPA